MNKRQRKKQKSKSMSFTDILKCFNKNLQKFFCDHENKIKE